jgi:hypothetical protein
MKNEMIVLGLNEQERGCLVFLLADLCPLSGRLDAMETLIGR